MKHPLPTSQEASRLTQRSDPVRTCVGCRRRARPGELVRCALTAEGVVVMSNAAPGRGAWLCRASIGCLDEAVKRRRFDRAFRRGVDVAAIAALREAFETDSLHMRDLTLVKG